jgi:2-oxoisovalerate ferredoxin oxidoreductase beta subunit
VAQLGVPITVIFINNAIYGMTGGQMAPTTLMGQKTSTSPYGRTRFYGTPMKMAELMATLDGPVYVERVALFDAKRRVKAAKAIKKGIRLQVERKGFSLIEVLAECPTHLKMTPLESEQWVKEKMLPIFPLGVKKDLAPEEGWPLPPTPSFVPGTMAEAIGSTGESAERFCEGFPRTPFGKDIAIKLAGAGGDGAQTAALLLTRAAINEGFDSTHIPSYGTSYADVRIAEDEVLSPAAPEPHALVAFNAPSLAKFGPKVVEGGVVVYDSSVIAEVPPLPPGVRAVPVPFAQIAIDLGKAIVKNVVALGALQEATQLFPRETILTAIRQALAHKCALIPLNEEAFTWGVKSAAAAGKDAS